MQNNTDVADIIAVIRELTDEISTRLDRMPAKLASICQRLERIEADS